MFPYLGVLNHFSMPKFCNKNDACKAEQNCIARIKIELNRKFDLLLQDKI